MKPNLIALLLVAYVVSGCNGKSNSMKADEFFDTKPQQNLAIAIDRNRLDEIGNLLADGVDINCRGKDHITPLIWAIAKQNKQSFQYLLKHGADPNLQVRQGESALSFAAIMEDSDYLRFTLEHGGNPNLVNPETGNVPIHEAIMNLRMQNIDLLIQHGANLDFQRRISGDTPLMDAASLNLYDVVYKMIKAGANVWIKCTSGDTVAFNIEQFPINPESDQYTWRNKVIDLLRAQGMDVRPWTPENGPGRKLNGKHPEDFGITFD